MQLLVLHLSDAHFRENANEVADRGQAIAAAALSAAPDASAILVAFSGDIAFSGAVAEYKHAEQFCTTLRVALTKQKAFVHFAFVPGNHDCDFTNESDVRHNLRAMPLEKLAEINISGDTAALALAVLRNFFDFTSRLNNHGSLTSPQQLAYHQTLAVGDKQILVRSYNTAWLSQKHEQQGQLCVPLEIIKANSAPCDVDLVLSVFHHSYPWLESANGRLFRTHIEHVSDLVLTGHDHVSESYTRKTLGGATARYTEGDFLQSSRVLKK